MLYSIFIDDIPNFNVLLSCLLCVCLALGVDRGHDGVIGRPTAPAAVYSPGSLYIAIVYLQLGGQSSPNGHIIASSSISPGYWDLFSLFSPNLPVVFYVLFPSCLLPVFSKEKCLKNPTRSLIYRRRQFAHVTKKGHTTIGKIFVESFKKGAPVIWDLPS